MKPLLIPTSIILLSSVFSGCNAVYTTTPLGEQPATLVADDIDGTWIHGDGAITVHVVNEEAGLLTVGWIEERNDALTLKEFSVELWELDDMLIANIVDEMNSDRYVWILLKKEGRNVVGWGPDLKRFRELVQSGEIEGTVKDKDVILNGLPSEQLKKLISTGESGAIDWENPGMIMRLGD